MIHPRYGLAAALVILVGGAQNALAQAETFVPGSRELFVMDFTKQPLGDMPKELRVLQGKGQVVEKEGAHMLRAAEPMEFMINLKENLPEAFTVEFDLIPKACCAPEDISFEGTPSQSRSPSSSHVVWRTGTVIVVGGGEYFQIPMPQDLSEILPNAPTRFNVSVDASGMKLYTHDRYIASLSGRKFAHGRVLRVFLGGQDDDLHAVYLGRIRIAAGGAPSGPVANNGPTPQISNNTSSTSSTATSTTTSSPTNPGTTPLPGLKVTVMLGALGPVVSWLPVADATGYSVTRQKIDDVGCCNSSSGRGYITATTWQDQPPPVSGTYNYLVLANTPAGLLRGEAQLGYRKPEASGVATSSTTPTTSTTTTQTTTTTTTPTTVTGVLATTTGTATPMTAPATGVPTTGTMVGTAPAGTISPTIVSPTGGSPAVVNGGTGAPDDVARYRVTLTGFRVSNTTAEPPTAPDGKYDEAYAAAAVILWDRKTSSVRSRGDVRTREYGDIGNGTFYGTRIKAGTGSATGGIWVGNGVEQIPADYDPSGSTIPAPTTDRFPLAVWEGSLTAGIEALLIVPSLWDRDIDSSPYTLWKQGWASTPLTSFFANPLITSQMIDPRLAVATPDIIVFTPFILTTPDAAAHIKDRPIGVFAQPPLVPVAVAYHDRHVMITREKLASLAAGASTTLAIPLEEPPSIVTGAKYTLYLRIDRLQ